MCKEGAAWSTPTQHDACAVGGWQPTQHTRPQARGLPGSNRPCDSSQSLGEVCCQVPRENHGRVGGQWRPRRPGVAQDGACVARAHPPLLRLPLHRQVASAVGGVWAWRLAQGCAGRAVVDRKGPEFTVPSGVDLSAAEAFTQAGPHTAACLWLRACQHVAGASLTSLSLPCQPRGLEDLLSPVYGCSGWPLILGHRQKRQVWSWALPVLPRPKPLPTGPASPLSRCTQWTRAGGGPGANGSITPGRQPRAHCLAPGSPVRGLCWPQDRGRVSGQRGRGEASPRVSTFIRSVFSPPAPTGSTLG